MFSNSEYKYYKNVLILIYVLENFIKKKKVLFTSCIKEKYGTNT